MRKSLSHAAKQALPPYDISFSDARNSLFRRAENAVSAGKRQWAVSSEV